MGSIGSIAVAPSNPRVIYAGTGEADMRSDIAYGDGMYKSTDGGQTWSHIGLTDTKQIGAIVVDPNDPNVVYLQRWAIHMRPMRSAASLRRPTAAKRGTKSSIKTPIPAPRHSPWNRVIPRFSTQRSGRHGGRRGTFIRPRTAPAAAFISSDAGATWTKLTQGLPAHVGRIGLSISAAGPNRIYANVDSSPGMGGIYRSDDSGATWTHEDGSTRLWQRGWYFSGITADPHNANVVYAMDTATYRSSDGGKSFDAILGDPTGDDFHTLWIDASDSNRMILGSDQGVVVSLNGAQTWSTWFNQPTAQFYHVATDDAFPYSAYGAQQDSGADMQAAWSKYGTLSQQDFRPLDVGGENGYLAPDPKHPGLVYGSAGGAGGPGATKEVTATGWELNVDPVIAYPSTLWRNTWTAPLSFSLADPRSLYMGHQEVFRSRNGGDSWQIVSPDLSRPNEGSPSNLDAATLADSNNVQRHGVVYAIAPSPIVANLVWAGTDDGYIWLSRNATASAPAVRWQNVTPQQLSSWSKVGIIEASHFDASTAYAAVDRHRLDDYAPYIYRTNDGGKTWTPIANGIPNGSFVNAVREDPKRRGLLYAGTERGLYVSFDDGANWQPLQLNLPVTSIRDIAIHGDDIVLATHGRSFWVMDDVASLRQMGAARAAGGDYLFAPTAAYRIREGNQEGTPLPLDEAQVDNQPTGLYIDYYLAREASSPVAIEILNAGGRVVRRWSSAEPVKAADPKSVDYTTHWIAQHPVPETSAGAHRFVWDFHQTDSRGPLLPPGSYTVRLRVDGKTFDRDARVMRDPRIAASDTDLVAQYELAERVIALRAEVAASRAKAQTLSDGSRLPAAQKQTLQRDVIGGEPPITPTIRWAPTPTISRASSSSKTSSIISRAPSKAPTPRRRPICAWATRSLTESIARRWRALPQSRRRAGSSPNGPPVAFGRTSARDRRETAPTPACEDRPCGRTRKIRN